MIESIRGALQRGDTHQPLQITRAEAQDSPADAKAEVWDLPHEPKA